MRKDRNDSNDEKIICKYCGSYFPRRDNLLKHVKNIHALGEDSHMFNLWNKV